MRSSSVVLPGAAVEDGVQVGRWGIGADPGEELAHGDHDQRPFRVRYDGVHGGHEGVDVEHQSARLRHCDGSQLDVSDVDLVEGDGVITQIGLQLCQAVGVVDGQRQLRCLVEPGLDEQITIGAFEVRRGERAGLVH